MRTTTVLNLSQWMPQSPRTLVKWTVLLCAGPLLPPLPSHERVHKVVDHLSKNTCVKKMPSFTLWVTEGVKVALSFAFP